MADGDDRASRDDPRARSEDPDAPTAGAVAELYLGNILYALERCAMSLEGDGKPVDAAFYRGIGRRLSEAHARSRSA